MKETSADIGNIDPHDIVLEIDESHDQLSAYLIDPPLFSQPQMPNLGLISPQQSDLDIPIVICKAQRTIILSSRYPFAKYITLVHFFTHLLHFLLLSICFTIPKTHEEVTTHLG